MSIAWQKIDDYLFVKLVGGLLARLGFVDIDYQGAGPDGGVDLFATELVPFAIQGRVPFRWAIQCKFSAKGTTASVNASEVQDIEGILRSERYVAQDARGFMLATNRQITQNLIERLRGIDRKTQFRTCRIDGSALEAMLSEHPQLVESIFSDQRTGMRGVGVPDAIFLPRDGSNQGEPLYFPIEIRSTGVFLCNPIIINAIIDTSSHTTILPRSAIEPLKLYPTGKVDLMLTPGNSHMVSELYSVQIGIERIGYFSGQYCVMDVEHAIIGQDLLSQFSILIHAGGGMSFYKK